MGEHIHLYQEPPDVGKQLLQSKLEDVVTLSYGGTPSAETTVLVMGYPFELSEHIHKFHNGPARELYSKFTMRGMNEMMVAGLITAGIVKDSELSPELADFLSPYTEFINRD